MACGGFWLGDTVPVRFSQGLLILYGSLTVSRYASQDGGLTQPSALTGCDVTDSVRKDWLGERRRLLLLECLRRPPAVKGRRSTLLC